MSNTNGQRIALVTGATSGLGRATAQELARQGWTTLVHGRDRSRTEELARQLTEHGGAAVPYVADLSSLEQVAAMGRRIALDRSELNLLINNAGAGGGVPGGQREVGADGFELRLTVNYLAPVLLTRLLRGALSASRPAQVLNVGSIGMSVPDFGDLQLTRGYGGAKAYTQSKFALAAFTFAAARAYLADGITVNCLHPATYMDTAMVREAGVSPWSTVEDGLRAVMQAVETGAKETGAFYDGTQHARGHARAYEAAIQDELEAVTAGLLGAVPGVEPIAWRLCPLEPGVRGEGQGLNTGAEGGFDDRREKR